MLLWLQLERVLKLASSLPREVAVSLGEDVVVRGSTSELITADRVPHRHLLCSLPVPADSLLTHDVEVAVLEDDLAASADRLAALEPHEADIDARSQPQTDNFAALRVAMPADTAVCRIGIEVAAAAG